MNKKPTAQELVEKLNDSQDFMDGVTSGFLERNERIFYRKPSVTSSGQMEYAELVDNTLASYLEKMPKNVIQKLPTFTVDAHTRNKAEDLVYEFIAKKIILRTGSSKGYGLLQKHWIAMRNAATFGACAAYLPFLNDHGEYTVGFDTAMNTAIQMVDRIRDTAQSHDRCSVVEVMGRRCGDIALQTGIATGATAILVPEVQYNIERDVIARIINTQKTGKKHFIVVVAEGVGGVRDLAKYVEQRLGIEARATVLGHVQRGGSPTLRDRVVASQMGFKAVELLEQNIGNRVVAMQGGKIIDLDINEALDMPRVFDEELYKIAMTISI